MTKYKMLQLIPLKDQFGDIFSELKGFDLTPYRVDEVSESNISKLQFYTVMTAMHEHGLNKLECFKLLGNYHCVGHRPDFGNFWCYREFNRRIGSADAAIDPYWSKLIHGQSVGPNSGYRYYVDLWIAAWLVWRSAPPSVRKLWVYNLELQKLWFDYKCDGWFVKLPKKIDLKKPVEEAQLLLSEACDHLMMSPTEGRSVEEIEDELRTKLSLIEHSPYSKGSVDIETQLAHKAARTALITLSHNFEDPL